MGGMAASPSAKAGTHLAHLVNLDQSLQLTRQHAFQQHQVLAKGPALLIQCKEYISNVDLCQDFVRTESKP
jgi:hypothetical protein